MQLKLGARLYKAFYILRKEGLISMLIAILVKIDKVLNGGTPSKKIKVQFLAKNSDIELADWVASPYLPSKKKHAKPYAINWVMSPPRSGGGHQNIFRFIKFLEDQGHTCRVYLYSVNDFATIPELRKGMKGSYPDTKASMEWLKGDMAPADVVFATGWETAYKVFNDPGKAEKFYFVQDFEPYFYPVGSEYVLAENTYRFNFHGITAGKWLAKKLSSEYGMKCDSYDFGANKELYSLKNKGSRKKVFFYARPVTARRGFELGIMALDLFHKQMPDYEIVLAGWDVSDYEIPFPCTNLKSLPLSELSELYNGCAAALVISLTNMSLLPLELLSCGTIPVVNDAPNNRLVSDNKYINYTQPSPESLASALKHAVEKHNGDYAQKISSSVADANWDTAGKAFLRALEDQLNG